MDRQLSEIGTIPVTTSIIESLYPKLKSADKKVTWLEKQGFIIRLKRGLYVAVHSYDIDPHSYDVDPLEEGRAFKEQSLFACKQAAA